MATTTAEAFDELHRRLALTDLQRVKVSTRVAATKTLLTSAFPASCPAPLRSISQIGSTARDTAIRPLTDLDVLVVFQNKNGVFEKYRHNSQSFLYWIRERVNARTEVRRVGARGQAVRLFYADGLHVDIAPVFRWSTEGYALPAGDASWITTDPAKQQVWLDSREKHLGLMLRPRVRLLKRWNAIHSKRLSSWHFEVLVGSVFASMGNDTRAVVEKFFEFAMNRLHVDDPDGHGGDLATSLSAAQQHEIRASFDSSRQRVRNARAAEAVGDHAESLRLWRIVLGEDFPAYG